MSSKGFLAVAVFAASILFSNFSTASRSGFDWSHGNVVSGGSVTVKVKSAPCQPVTVVLFVDGHRIEGTITETPGTITISCPAGTQGLGYTVEVRCPNDRESESGQVM